MTQAIDPKNFRSVMGKFATGVNIVGYWRDAEPAALTVNAFMSVSLDPPLVLVSIRDASAFLDQMKHGDCFGVSMLGEDQRQISNHFGGRPVEGLASPLRIKGGAPLVEGAIATVVARIVDIHPAGDHQLVLGRVEALDAADGKPLIYFSGGYAGLG